MQDPKKRIPERYLTYKVNGVDVGKLAFNNWRAFAPRESWGAFHENVEVKEAYKRHARKGSLPFKLPDHSYTYHSYSTSFNNRG